MNVSIIAAMGKEKQIGKNNQLLWRISDDLKNFKKLTSGHHMLMGRKTYESIGRPLPGRTTVIMTRNSSYKAEGCKIVHSFEEALSLSEESGDNELFICGGEQIYRSLLEKADKFYLSFVDFDGEADVFFPDLSYETLNIMEEVDHPAEGITPAWIYKVFKRK